MLRSALKDQPVAGLLRLCLGSFQQQAFFVAGDDRSLMGAPAMQQLPDDHSAGGSYSSVQIDGSDDGLIGIGQDGGVLSAALENLSPVHEQVMPQTKTSRLPGQSGLAHQMGTKLGQATLRLLREPAIELRSDDET
jgi:hypothetical protein